MLVLFARHVMAALEYTVKSVESMCVQERQEPARHFDRLRNGGCIFPSVNNFRWSTKHNQIPRKENLLMLDFTLHNSMAVKSLYIIMQDLRLKPTTHYYLMRNKARRVYSKTLNRCCWKMNFCEMSAKIYQ